MRPAGVGLQLDMFGSHFPVADTQASYRYRQFKATWAGAALELSRKSTFTGQDGTERTSSETRKLSLSGDGKVLTAAVHSEGGRGGPTDSTLVFNK